MAGAGLRFVVTGTGRSGTGYAAHLYRAAGLRCGHEEVFTDHLGWGEQGPRRQGAVARAKAPLGRLREERRRRATGLDGDSSWMAAPRLSRVHAHRVLLTRHPLPVIRSFMGTRFFSEPSRAPAQHRYATAHLSATGDDVVDAMRWWVFWNGLAAEHADTIVRLEDLDAATFAGLLAAIGEPDAERRAHDAVAAVGRDTNSSEARGDQRGSIGWADLPSGADRERLARACERFHYDVEA